MGHVGALPMDNTEKLKQLKSIDFLSFFADKGRLGNRKV